MQIYIYSIISSIAYIYLLVKFVFCLFFSGFFHVYLLPIMVNKDVYIIIRLWSSILGGISIGQKFSHSYEQYLILHYSV